MMKLIEHRAAVVLLLGVLYLIKWQCGNRVSVEHIQNIVSSFLERSMGILQVWFACQNCTLIVVSARASICDK